MSVKNVTTLLALVMVALTSVAFTQTGQASEDNAEEYQATSEGSNGEQDRGRKATLDLRGEPGTEFSGSCAVGDEEPEEISGQVPESYDYKLKPRLLNCEISSDEDMRVELDVGNNARSVQQISGGT